MTSASLLPRAWPSCTKRTRRTRSISSQSGYWTILKLRKPPFPNRSRLWMFKRTSRPTKKPRKSRPPPKKPRSRKLAQRRRSKISSKRPSRIQMTSVTSSKALLIIFKISPAQLLSTLESLSHPRSRLRTETTMRRILTMLQIKSFNSTTLRRIISS